MKKYKVQIRSGRRKSANFRTDHVVVTSLLAAKERAHALKYHYPSHDIRIVIETYEITKKEILK